MARFFLAFPVLLLLAAPAMAADQTPQKNPPKASQAAPDPALLEFIGTWESPDGQWVDPMTFERIDPAKPAPGNPGDNHKLSKASGKPPGNGSGGKGV